MSAEEVAAAPVVSTLGIVGAGLMGSGIAQVAAQRDIRVRLFDAAEGAAQRAIAGIDAQLERLVARERITAEDAESAQGRIDAVETLEGLARADAVIEAVIEDVAVKRDVFDRLAAITGPATLLATNTSAIPVSAIAGPGAHADRVVGMHFFSPVPVMQLCEIVRGLDTSDETVSRARALSEALGKQSILVNRDTAGFVTSRLMTVLVQEAARIVDEGLATPEDVDAACVLGFGHRMGPLATADLTGVDVAYRAGKSIFEATGDSSFRPPQLFARMVAAGRLGRKTGRGFYEYAEEAR